MLEGFRLFCLWLAVFYGQIDGLVVGGLALAWWALWQEKPALIGAGLIIASIKPQLSLPLCLAIWWWSPSRLKSLLVPILVVAASFVQWGWWLLAWLDTLRSPDDLVTLSRNVSLWPMVGAWVWLSWPVILVLPLPRPQKLIALRRAQP